MVSTSPLPPLHLRHQRKLRPPISILPLSLPVHCSRSSRTCSSVFFSFSSLISHPRRPSTLICGCSWMSSERVLQAAFRCRVELLPYHALLLQRRPAHPVRDILVPSLSVFIWPSLRHAIVATSCSLAAGVFFLFNSTMHRSTHHSAHASKHDLAPC
jgi:hypothetical protein